LSAPTKREGPTPVPVPRPGKTPPFEPKAGLLIAGKYRIERVIGEGGMGVVVAATHEGLDQKVAIKFLAPEAIRNSEAVERFMREAKVAAKVKSEHVARVSDVGRIDGATPFIVMEYLEGAELAAMIDTQKPLPIDEVCEIGLQACEALAEVHAADIVHRDLKPSNLFVTRRADGSPCLKLLDFGISKFTTSPGDDGADPALTATATVMGSPSYMSPEQLKSTKEVDARTDVWSLGAVLYEALTGKPAFRGETVPQVVAMIASEEPATPTGIRADIASELETAVLSCLVKNADQRSTLVGLARTLVRFAPERARVSLDRVESVLGAERSQKSMPIVAIKPPEIARTQSSWGEEDKGRKRGGNSTTLMFLGTIAAIAVGIAVYTGKIDLLSLRGPSGSATSAESAASSAKRAKAGPSASTTTITVPPIASIVAPIASVVEPIMSALAPAASSAPPVGSAAPVGSAQDDGDAGDDADEDDEEPAATPPTGTVYTGPSPHPVAHPAQPKHVQPKPKRPKRKHH
jgi:serine/threonine-protein kinase